MRRFEIDDFSSREKLQSRSRLRLLVEPREAEKAKYKPLYWSVALLVRLCEKVDELLSGEDPEFGLELAECIPTVAARIKIGPEERDYQDDAEKDSFIALCEAIYASALQRIGQPREARRQINIALRKSAGKHVDSVAKAEVLRRATYLALESAEFEAALKLGQRAVEYFIEEKVFDRLALTFIYLGQARSLLGNRGDGLPDFVQSLYYGAKSSSSAGRRAVIAAAENIACDLTLGSSPIPPEAAQWIAAAREAMKGQPKGLAKVKIEWVHALANYRLGLGRYAIRALTRVQSKLLEFSAFGDAVACTADLLAAVREFDPENLDSTARKSAQLILAATPEAARPLLEAWAEQPADAGALRQAKKELTRSG